MKISIIENHDTVLNMFKITTLDADLNVIETRLNVMDFYLPKQTINVCVDFFKCGKKYRQIKYFSEQVSEKELKKYIDKIKK